MEIQQLLQVRDYRRHLSLILTVLKAAIWPYTFTPIATALAALVTQIYLGYR